MFFEHDKRLIIPKMFGVYRVVHADARCNLIITVPIKTSPLLREHIEEETTMPRFAKSLVIFAIALIASPASAATVFTSSGPFLSLVEPGSFLNTFSTGGNGGGAAIPGPLTFSGSGYSYDVTAGGAGFFADNAVLGNWAAADPVVFTFTGAPVTAIGGNFFLTDVNGVLQTDANVTISLSDGTNESFQAVSTSSFRGFISTVPITSMTFAAVPRFYNIDNFRVGAAAVPEPATLSLVAAAGAIGFVLRRRRA